MHWLRQMLNSTQQIKQQLSAQSELAVAFANLNDAFEELCEVIQLGLVITKLNLIKSELMNHERRSILNMMNINEFESQRQKFIQLLKNLVPEQFEWQRSAKWILTCVWQFSSHKKITWVWQSVKIFR
jgi:hypothetical protein